MKPYDILGIFCSKTQKFYYFDNGPGNPRNNIDRIRNVLIARDILRLTDAPDTNIAYKIMRLSEAEQKGYEIEILFPNSHVAKVREPVDPIINVWD
jgi:hypothetical protein